MAKTQKFKISQTLKEVGNWLVSDKISKVRITNPIPELAANFNQALESLEDSPKIINNPR